MTLKYELDADMVKMNDHHARCLRQKSRRLTLHPDTRRTDTQARRLLDTTSKEVGNERRRRLQSDAPESVCDVVVYDVEGQCDGSQLSLPRPSSKSNGRTTQPSVLSTELLPMTDIDARHVAPHGRHDLQKHGFRENKSIPVHQRGVPKGGIKGFTPQHCQNWT